jgi:DNA-binding response OmpR family regulator
MKRVLICEDEDAIRDFLTINLKRSGYTVEATATGEEAVAAVDAANAPNAQPFTVCVLDIMLPGISGVEVCSHVREKSASTGIIMLSARSRELDKVQCLMLGADDYVTKPFSPSELVARVDALARRVGRPGALTSKDEAAVLHSGPFRLNRKSRLITKDNVPLDLTQVEYHIMEYFIMNAEIALERPQILYRIWGENYYGDEKIVDVNMRRLRVKIEDDPSTPQYIQTVWGCGYRWNHPLEST